MRDGKFGTEKAETEKREKRESRFSSVGQLSEWVMLIKIIILFHTRMQEKSLNVIKTYSANS